MATIVRFDDRCRIDIGDRTVDRWVLIREMVRSLIDQLGTHGGDLPGAARIATASVPRFIWEDSNWRSFFDAKNRRRLETPVSWLAIELVKLKW